MPLVYRIAADQNLVIAVGSGVGFATEARDHLNALANDEACSPPTKKPVDCREVESISISEPEAAEIARLKVDLIPKFSGERCAFVAPKDLVYGVSRVHQARVGQSGASAGSSYNLSSFFRSSAAAS